MFIEVRRNSIRGRTEVYMSSKPGQNYFLWESPVEGLLPTIEATDNFYGGLATIYQRMNFLLHLGDLYSGCWWSAQIKHTSYNPNFNNTH